MACLNALDQTRNIEIRFDVFITDCNSFFSPKLMVSLLKLHHRNVFQSSKKVQMCEKGMMFSQLKKISSWKEM